MTIRKIIEFRKKRFLIGAILGIGSFLACYIAYHSMMAAAVFLVLFLIGGTICFSQEKVQGKKVAVIYFIWFAVAALAVELISQLEMNEILPERRISIVMQMILILVPMLILFVITLKPRISALIAAAVLCFFSCVNYFVFLFRGSEIMPADLLSLKTAGNVAAEYRIIIPSFMFYAWLFLTFFFFLSSALPPVHIERRGKTRIKTGIVLIVSALSLVIGGMNIRPLHWLQTGSVINGFLWNFTLLFKEAFVQEPDGYNADQVEAIAAEYEQMEAENGRTPDIIVVMNESFADFNVLGDNFHTNVEVTPFINQLVEDTTRGYTLSSVFGGGTPNSEYEFLSGNSLAYLPAGAIVYQQYINEPVYTMASELSNRGYVTAALHPYQANSWMRDIVWPKLGFEDLYFLDSFPQKSFLREWLSDQEMYETMTDLYEGYIAEEEERPVFMFGVTIQNHGGYTYSGPDFDTIVQLEGYRQNYDDVEQYLTCIHASDKAVEWLIRYFEKIDRDVVVLFYGDHYPRLDEHFFEEVYGEPQESLNDQMMLYKVPFFIWTNFDSEEGTVDITSMNYLSNLIYQKGNMEMPAYNQYLEDLQKIIPAINSQGYYSLSEKEFLSIDEAEGEELEALNEYNCVEYNNMFDDENRSEIFDLSYPEMGQGQ